MGFMDVMVVLNADILAGGFRGKGIAVKISTPPDHADVFLRATRRVAEWELSVQVGPELREQMLIELMTPANVVGAVDRLLEVLAERGPAGLQEQHAVALADERRVWEGV